MENLVNKIEGVTESFIFGKQQSDDKNDIKINVKVVYDKEVVENVYKAKTKEDIYRAIFEKIKEVNSTMPQYKAIREQNPNQPGEIAQRKSCQSDGTPESGERNKNTYCHD